MSILSRSCGCGRTTEIKFPVLSPKVLKDRITLRGGETKICGMRAFGVMAAKTGDPEEVSEAALGASRG